MDYVMRCPGFSILIPERLAEADIDFGASRFQTQYVSDLKRAKVILTLIPTNTYLINTNEASATIGLDDNFTNSPFQLVATNLIAPAGMAYHPLSNCLIVSINSNPGQEGLNDFVRVDTNGNVSTSWTGISNLVDEIKLAIVQTNAAGFTAGDTYFGTGTNGVIGKLSADGTVSNLDWLTLPGESQHPSRQPSH